MEKFKKKDLRFGDIVTLRNEEKGIFVDNNVITNNYDLYVDRINEDLTNNSAMGNELDIMKVERYERTAMSDKLYTLKTLYERKEEILDAKEKEYLSNIIRPFKDRIQSISKKDHELGEKIFIDLDDCSMFLPLFKKGTMYKNMELNKEYTLEELGL